MNEFTYSSSECPHYERSDAEWVSEEMNEFTYSSSECPHYERSDAEWVSEEMSNPAHSSVGRSASWRTFKQRVRKISYQKSIMTSENKEQDISFWVYVIKNDKGYIYIGQTSDLMTRLKRHNGLLKNKPLSFTNRHKGKWELVYEEKFNSRKLAVDREKQLKSYQGRKFIRGLAVK